MDRWLTLLSLVLVVLGTYFGYRKVRSGSSTGASSFQWLLAACISQYLVISIRGKALGACPLHETSELLMFLAWSLMLVYLLMGSVYRVSLMGFFTMPFTALLLLISLLPGVYTPPAVERLAEVDPWLEAHASLYILAYGVLLLSSIASLMFLFINHQLKQKRLNGALFTQMAPLSTLVTSSLRLLIFAVILITIAMVAGYQVDVEQHELKNWIGRISWISYLGLIIVTYTRGLPPIKIALSNLLIFGFSLLAISLV